MEAGKEKIKILIKEAQVHSVDLIFVSRSNNGLCVLSYKPVDDYWLSFEGMESISRASLMKGVVVDWKNAAAYTRPIDKQFDSMTEITIQIADMVIKNVNPGSRIAFVITPELSNFPIIPIFANIIAKVRGKGTAIGEINFNGGAFDKINYESNCLCGSPDNCSYIAFVDKDITLDEIKWGENGLKGKTRTNFSCKDILKALTDETDLVHIVVHGHYEKESPMFSFLETPKGPFFSWQLLDVVPKTKLLILNSCSSMAGGAFTGWHSSAPMRLAVTKGVETALGNIVPVPTSEAMKTCTILQRQLIKNGMSIAEAYTVAVTETAENKYQFNALSLLGRSINSLFSPFFIEGSTET